MTFIPTLPVTDEDFEAFAMAQEIARLMSDELGNADRIATLKKEYRKKINDYWDKLYKEDERILSKGDTGNT